GLTASTTNIDVLLCGPPEHNAEVLRRTLAGEQGAVRDIVLFNAAAGIVAYRLFQDPAQAQRNLIQRLVEALGEAAAAIDDGRATARLEQWVAATRQFDTRLGTE